MKKGGQYDEITWDTHINIITINGAVLEVDTMVINAVIQKKWYNFVSLIPCWSSKVRDLLTKHLKKNIAVD